MVQPKVALEEVLLLASHLGLKNFYPDIAASYFPFLS
jgi:hypothetical protein